MAQSSKLAKFGPGNCIATWRNEDGHCNVETHCKDHDISKYAVKFICIDDGGEKVRHVFAAGSFDPEEQFDTLIECKKCLAEKEEKIQVIAKSGEKTDEPGAAALTELRQEVKDLEAFMINTSAALQKLNAKVYSKDFHQQQQVKTTAPQASAASLVHHETVHHTLKAAGHPRIEAEAERVRKAHKSHRDDDVKQLATRIAASRPSSLTGALRTAEARSDKIPVQQPPKLQMMLRTQGRVQKLRTKDATMQKMHDQRYWGSYDYDDENEDEEEGRDDNDDDAEENDVPRSTDDESEPQEDQGVQQEDGYGETASDNEDSSVEQAVMDEDVSE